MKSVTASKPESKAALIVGKGMCIEEEIQRFVSAHGKEITFGHPQFWNGIGHMKSSPYPVRLPPALKSSILVSNVGTVYRLRENSVRELTADQRTKIFALWAQHEQVYLTSDRLGAPVYVLRIELANTSITTGDLIAILELNGNVHTFNGGKIPLRISKAERPESNEITITGSQEGDSAVIFWYAKGASLSVGGTEVAPEMHELGRKVVCYEDLIKHHFGAAWIPRAQTGTEEACLRLMAHMESRDYNINAVTITFLD